MFICMNFVSVDKKVSEMKLGPQNVNKDFE